MSKRTKKASQLTNTALLFSFTFLERRRLRKARKYPQHARAHTRAGLHRNERRARYEHVIVDTVVRIESLVGKSILLLVTKIDVEIFSSEGEEKRSDVSNQRKRVRPLLFWNDDMLRNVGKYGRCRKFRVPKVQGRFIFRQNFAKRELELLRIYPRE